jgi:hypothetical protein
MQLPSDRAHAHARLVAAARTLARAVEVAGRATARRADTPPPLPTEPTHALRVAVAELLAAEREAGVELGDGTECATRIVRSALWDGAGRLSAQTVARILIATRRAATAASEL